MSEPLTGEQLAVIRAALEAYQDGAIESKRLARHVAPLLAEVERLRAELATSANSLATVQETARILADRVTAQSELLSRRAERSSLEVATEREACAVTALGAMDGCGTDNPHEALQWAADAIRARSEEITR